MTALDWLLASPVLLAMAGTVAVLAWTPYRDRQRRMAAERIARWLERQEAARRRAVRLRPPVVARRADQLAAAIDRHPAGSRRLAEVRPLERQRPTQPPAAVLSRRNAGGTTVPSAGPVSKIGHPPALVDNAPRPPSPRPPTLTPADLLAQAQAQRTRAALAALVERDPSRGGPA